MIISLITERHLLKKRFEETEQLLRNKEKELILSKRAESECFGQLQEQNKQINNYKVSVYKSQKELQNKYNQLRNKYNTFAAEINGIESCSEKLKAIDKLQYRFLADGKAVGQ